MNKNKYSFREIEEKWNSQFIESNSNKEKYILEMFMYPSGKVHMGHGRNFTIADVIVRYNTLLGYKVFCPIGWDSFGLPAENAAINNNVHPQTWTYSNIETMKNTIKKLNYIYDWSREMKTCDSLYIKFQQKLFLDLYRNGLVEKKEEWVNWDPIDKTVLANEQVENGIAWRSGAKVEKKRISQWFFKITKYSEELLKDIDTLDWPEPIKIAQKHWIGKKIGYYINFKDLNGEIIRVYTTTPEVVYGCTFLAVAPDSDFAYKIAPEITKEYLLNPEGLYEIGKAINIYNNQTIPIYLADYVFANYGTGIIMGVPAHDDRDNAFAQKYGLSIINVLDENEKLINSKDWNGLIAQDIRSKFESVTCYRLRDWIISRQRYWGCPIPIIYCKKCGIVEAETPVLLPFDVSFGKGNPLDNETWKKTKCPKCNEDAEREIDTMDTFVDSSWYFLRYPYANNENIIFENAKPVDVYIGGAEHAVLHLLYARFMTKALRDLGYLNFNEPFLKLINQGMVCAPTYKGIKTNKYYYPNDCILENGEMEHIKTGEKIKVGAPVKMSKSLLNIIDPEDMLIDFGCDALRLFIISDSPINQTFMWNTNGLFGCRKFLDKIWNYSCTISDYIENNENLDFKIKINHFIAIINEHISNNELNVFSADLRIFFDFLKNNKSSEENIKYGFKYFLKSLWIICPSLANECYSKFYDDLIYNNWISGEKEQDNNNLLIAINGKKQIEYNYNQESEEDLIKIVTNILNLKIFKRYIYKSGKILNFII